MAIPKYQYIKDELKNKIISGQFASGDKFYTEAELIAMYDVSSITVVRALNDLAKDDSISMLTIQTLTTITLSINVSSWTTIST